MAVLQGSGVSASYAPTSGSTSGQTAVLTVTAPDGTTSTPTVTNATSQWTAIVPAAQVGAYLLVWTVTGGATAVVSKDQFVSVAPGLDLLSLGDLKDQLNITPTDTSGNEKLRRFLLSATAVVENITGPVLPTPRVDVFDGGVESVILPFRWVKSITSITESLAGVNYTLTNQPLGSATDSYGYTWDQTINKIVRRQSNSLPRLFPPGVGVVTVTYVAGMSSIPQDIGDAAGELIRHWWSNGQTAFSNPFAASSDDGVPTQMIMGYAIPNRVVEMLAPYARRPGMF